MLSTHHFFPESFPTPNSLHCLIRDSLSDIRPYPLEHGNASSEHIITMLELQAQEPTLYTASGTQFNPGS